MEDGTEDTDTGYAARALRKAQRNRIYRDRSGQVGCYEPRVIKKRLGNMSINYVTAE